MTQTNTKCHHCTDRITDANYGTSSRECGTWGKEIILCSECALQVMTYHSDKLGRVTIPESEK